MYRAYLPPPLPRVSKKIIFYFREIFFENLFVFFILCDANIKYCFFAKIVFVISLHFREIVFAAALLPPPPTTLPTCLHSI